MLRLIFEYTNSSLKNNSLTVTKGLGANGHAEYFKDTQTELATDIRVEDTPDDNRTLGIKDFSKWHFD